MKKIDYATYQKPSRFVKFGQGDTRVRIVSSGVIVYEHGMSTKRGFVPMGTCSEDLNCKQCKKGNDPSLKYKWIVFLPETQEVKVLSVGPQVGDEICVIGKQEDDAGRPTFEVIITRTGTTRDDTRYRVKRVTEPTPIDVQTGQFIKQSRDYLFRKYLT